MSQNPCSEAELHRLTHSKALRKASLPALQTVQHEHLSMMFILGTSLVRDN